LKPESRATRLEHRALRGIFSSIARRSASGILAGGVGELVMKLSTAKAFSALLTSASSPRARRLLDTLRKSRLGMS